MPPRERSNADLMREWRRLAGINTADAGDVLGLSARTIEGIEQGRREEDRVLQIALKKLILDAK